MSNSGSTFTLKNKAFVDEYFSNGQQATQAYITVYDGVSYDTAKSRASKLLQKPACLPYLEAKRAEIAKRSEIRTDDIVQHLKKLLTSENQFVVLRALDQLSKIAGVYKTTPTTNIMTSGPMKIDFGGYNPDAEKEILNLENSEDTDKLSVEDNDPED